MKKLRIKLKKANHLAAKEIEKNVRKFGIIAKAAERDLKKLKGAGKVALRGFRSELKSSWKDLKRVAQKQF
jgi:archaellum component FlaC